MDSAFGVEPVDLPNGGASLCSLQQNWQTREGRDVRILLLSDEALPVSLIGRLLKVPHQRLRSERASTRTLYLATMFAPPKGSAAIANVWCYGHLAKEVLVEVLGHLFTQFGGRLILAGVEFIANWSLDTVNTYPRCVHRGGNSARNGPGDTASGWAKKMNLDRIEFYCGARFAESCTPSKRPSL